MKVKISRKDKEQQEQINVDPRKTLKKLRIN